MTCLISRSSRNKTMFCVICNDKESNMEFPFKDGAKHLKHASKIKKWLLRNTTQKQTTDKIVQS